MRNILVTGLALVFVASALAEPQGYHYPAPTEDGYVYPTPVLKFDENVPETKVVPPPPILKFEGYSYPKPSNKIVIRDQEGYSYPKPNIPFPPPQSTDIFIKVQPLPPKEGYYYPKPTNTPPTNIGYVYPRPLIPNKIPFNTYVISATAKPTLSPAVYLPPPRPLPPKIFLPPRTIKKETYPPPTYLPPVTTTPTPPPPTTTKVLTVPPSTYLPPTIRSPPTTYLPPPTTTRTPPSTYLPPQTSYLPPRTTYLPPRTTYLPPPTTTRTPPSTYLPPQTSYLPPRTTYLPPRTTYLPPRTTYLPPPTTTRTPPSTYLPPPTTPKPTPPTRLPPSSPTAYVYPKPLIPFEESNKSGLELLSPSLPAPPPPPRPQTTTTTTPAPGYLPPNQSGLELLSPDDDDERKGEDIDDVDEEPDHDYHLDDGPGKKDDHAHWDIRKSIPGEPGVDYPTLRRVPKNLKFSCDGRPDGYYADIETRCQVFHICAQNAAKPKTSFLCNNGSIFNQEMFVCDWWKSVDCSKSEENYSLNLLIGTNKNLPVPRLGDNPDSLQALKPLTKRNSKRVNFPDTDLPRRTRGTEEKSENSNAELRKALENLSPSAA